MDLVFLILTASVVLAVLLVSRLAASRDAQAVVPKPDQAPKKYPELAIQAQRAVFGMNLTQLVDRSNAFTDAVEIGLDGTHDFTRITVFFPTRLRSGIHLALESQNGLLKRLMNMRETRVGNDQFDSQFIVLGSSQIRVEKTLSDAIREQLLNLRSHVVELRLTDEAVFVRVPSALPPEQLKPFLTQCHQLAHNYYERAQGVDEELREALERNPELLTADREASFGISGRQPWKTKK